MGWWNQKPDGTSLEVIDTGLVWGDGPADTMDTAIAEIVHQFQSAWTRKPTKAELEAGLKFSLGSYEEGT